MSQALGSWPKSDVNKKDCTPNLVELYGSGKGEGPGQQILKGGGRFKFYEGNKQYVVTESNLAGQERTLDRESISAKTSG